MKTLLRFSLARNIFGPSWSLKQNHLSRGKLKFKNNFGVRNSSSSLDVRLEESTRRLVVPNLTLNTREDQFPWVWLRDNCQCSKCYEPISQCRIVNLTEWNINTKPLNVKNNGDSVEMVWEDGHISVFDKSWLADRSFDPQSRSKFRESENISQVLWGKELTENTPTADFSSIMSNDQSLLSWLEDLDRFGFVLVKNVPVEEGPVPALQKRVAFEKLTHYGPGYTVVVRDDPANISHTAHRIFFHTDLTYYDYMPGSVFLHCIKQHEGKGGETMLCDGFNAARILAADWPDMYQLLANSVTSFRDVGEEMTQFDKITHLPFLIHNSRNELVRINWSHFARDSHLDVDIDKVENLYTAMRKFDDLMNLDENHIRLKMEPGDMVTVKNTRILHGRTELSGEMSGRHLQCGYMDWDEIRSTRRVLKKNLAA